MVKVALSEMIIAAGDDRAVPSADRSPPLPPPPPLFRLVRLLYERLANDIAAHKPVCNNRGDCCKFESFGHRLYVTSVELRYFAHHQSAAGFAIVTGASCPYQIDKRCTAREHRPLGCRIFFCDPNSQQWQPPLYERYLSRLKRLGARYGVDYEYGEWLGMLRNNVGGELHFPGQGKNGFEA